MWKICYMIFACITRDHNILNNTNMKLEKNFFKLLTLRTIRVLSHFNEMRIACNPNLQIFPLLLAWKYFLGIRCLFIRSCYRHIYKIDNWIFQSCLVYFTSYLEDIGLVLQVNKKNYFWACNLLATWFLLDFSINRQRCRCTSSSQVPWYWNI